MRRLPISLLEVTRLAARLVAGAATLLCAADAFARPGGGESFSGGSSGDDSGDSGESGGGAILLQLVLWLLQLTMAYPKVMLPLWGVSGLAFWAWNRSLGNDWTAGGRGQAGESETAEGSERKLPRRELERLRASDPEFSVLLFEDFLQALFARVHEARGAQTLDAVTPYLKPELRARLERESQGLTAVDGIVVGAMRYDSVAPPGEADDRWTVEVVFVANYIEVSPAARRGLYAVERWTLSRAAGARSRPPDRVRSFGCPACGAPLTGLRDDRCAHCGQLVTSGEFDWRVERIFVQNKEAKAPELAGHVREAGNLLPTIVDPDAVRLRDELCRRDPQFSWDGLDARVRHIFAVIQVAWSTQELAKARPYLSDNLFQTWVYWIEAYRAAGLRNVTENSKLLGMRLVRVSSDPWYDAITVRVRAIGLDYTLDSTGWRVSGSREDPREYSEYWTLVRGAAVRGAARADSCCPRCGAPLVVNQAGSCEHCGAHVVSGSFDWVLSRIEQDEVYQG